MTNNNQVSVTYSDTELRSLVEEYIAQQKTEFSLKGVCSYILYWAVEEGKIANGNSQIESEELQASDQGRVKHILEAVIADGRIAFNPSNPTQYKKANN